MTFMAFMLLIILFGVFFLFFWNLNPHDVTIHLFGNQDITYPVAFVVVGGILIGLMLGFGAHIYSLLLSMWKHWKRDQAEKLNREVGAIYREGVDHLLSGDLKKARELLQKALDRDPRRLETHIAMANLVAGERVVPELIQDEATPGRIAAEVQRLLEAPEERARVRRRLEAARASLGAPGAAGRAAEAVLEVLEGA